MKCGERRGPGEGRNQRLQNIQSHEQSIAERSSCREDNQREKKGNGRNDRETRKVKRYREKLGNKLESNIRLRSTEMPIDLHKRS